MKEKYSLFVPWISSFGYKSRNICLRHNYKQRQFCFKYNEKPFFGLVNDGSDARFFIDAILSESDEDAEMYISEQLRLCVSFAEVKKIFEKAKGYKYLVGVSKRNLKGEKVNSILITDSDKKRVGIVHLYMVNEPDIFSNWKVYKIEREFIRQ